MQTDKDLAEALGMEPAAYNKRKIRGSFPEKELRALVRQSPELGIDEDYVLKGITNKAIAHLNAMQERISGAVDAGADVEQVRNLIAHYGPGPSPERIGKLAAMLAKLRVVEFEAFFNLAESITQVRDALEQTAAKPNKAASSAGRAAREKRAR
ncbi:MAG: hypothetical protein LBE78_13015 [Burkholderiaceae bacterium]|nr:hypothetical protein [Burkholderiaceae bacterium]